MLIYKKRDAAARIFAKKASDFGVFERIVLFGSTARKEDLFDSDIDVALVLSDEHASKIKNIKEQLTSLATEILLKEQLLINWLVVSSSDWEEEHLPIIKNIKSEGIILWEKEKPT